MMNKKIIALFMLVFLLALACPGKTTNLQPVIKSIGQKAWVITGNYFNEHMTVVETSIGLVIVDTLTTAAATGRAMGLVRKFTTKPVKYVINTHFDIDHYGGNQLFPKATIIGHINCPKHYEFQIFNKKSNIKDFHNMIDSMNALVPGRDPVSIKKRESYINWFKSALEGFDGFKFTPPTLFVRESKTILCGKTEIRLLHFGPGHTDADLVVHFPHEKIVVTGDLVLGQNTIPVIHRIHGGNIINTVSILDQLKKIANTGTTLVPGHGTYTGIEVINDQRQYLTQLLDRVKAAQKKGLDLKTARKEIKMERFKNHWLYEMMHQGNVETAWIELRGEEKAN